MEVIQFDPSLCPAPQATFESIAAGIIDKGYSVCHNGLPETLAQALWFQVQSLTSGQFVAAGIGRESEHQQNQFVRRDEIHWIFGDSDVGKQWLNWTAQLQQYLNRHLFLGLFSFESHFAHYRPGDFYKRHVDAFKGQANRILSLVVYLNPGWQVDDGGEIVIYQDQYDLHGTKVLPHFATVVAFLSEDFPHEVLAAQRDRYSIAGWFRINSSTADRVDPPR